MGTANQLPAPPLLASIDAASLFLDFDGTLVEIAATPDGIVVPPNLSARLGALSKTLGGALAVVSGRSLDDLTRHIGDLPVARAGSHGASRLNADGTRIGDAPDGLPDAVTHSLGTFAETRGLTFENKSHGAALHYRAKPGLQDTTVRFARALASENGLETKEGKSVVEIVRPGADKAGAVGAFMATEPFAGTIPIFIGDDVTDEDGFLAAIRHGGFGIAVGERESASASYHLCSVSDVYEWTKL